ncbi:MAG: hypothetical protein OEV78_00320 [Spirochaetia bacterium]|nr:hypothetical protein [Spirochaetia bacterium]
MKQIFIYLSLFIIITNPVLAGTHSQGMFSINVDNETTYGSAANSLVSTLDSQFNENTFKKTLWYMADSQSMSTRGLGVTYATNHNLFLVAFSGNTGFSPGSRSISEFYAAPFAAGPSGIPEAGIGIQSSILAGLSLKSFHLKPVGYLDPSRLTLFINFFAFKITTPLDVSTLSAGVHFQYKIINEINILFGLLYWGGLDISSGIDITNNVLNLPVGLFFTSQIAGGLEFTPAGNLGFTNTAITIPVEVSTNIRLAYALSLIAGGAIDVNMGNSKFDLGGPVTDTTSGAKVGTLSTNERSRMSASFVDARLFFGPQINLIPLPSGKNILSITLLGDLSTNHTYGVHLSINTCF